MKTKQPDNKKFSEVAARFAEVAADMLAHPECPSAVTDALCSMFCEVENESHKCGEAVKSALWEYQYRNLFTVYCVETSKRERRRKPGSRK